MTDSVERIISRGQKINNPLNIRRSNINWAGKSALPRDEAFETFDDAHHGIRAAARNLLTYYRRDKLNTVQEIVAKWAPPEDDNDTGAYITAVASRMAVAPDTELNLEDREVLGSLVIAMMKQEIGSVPYSPQTIETAVAAAYSGGSSRPPIISVIDAQPQPLPPPIAPQPIPVPNTGRPPLVDQPTTDTTNKVKASTLGALAGFPAAWIAKVFWDQYGPGEPMPMEVALGISAAASGLVAYVAGYYTRNRAVTTIST